MKPLKNQLEMEALILRSADDPTKICDPNVCVQFSASWCAPCKRIDKTALIEKYGDAITWYICDVDENDYTLGYCGLRKIPSFVLIKNGKFAGRLEGCSSTTDILGWLEQYMN